MNLRQIGEFGLIRRIQKKFPARSSSIFLGLGDDAAAILPSPQKILLLTTDSLVEEVHFDLSFSTFFQVGYKAMAVNISDIAAMGGTPRFYLVSLGLTDQTPQEIDRLYRGIQKGGKEAGAALIGGNTAHSKKTFFVSLTLLGEVPKKEMVTRGGGRPGDALYITGSVGDAAAGLEILQKGGGAFQPLIRRYQAPPLRWREGRLLAERRIASAMIDLSDGLSSDLSHIMEQSGVGAELDLSALPLSSSLKRYALQTGNDPLKYALNGGGDYELLFSVPRKKVKVLDLLIQSGAVAARRIGALVHKKRGFTGRDPGGRIRKIEPGGYDHFRRN